MGERPPSSEDMEKGREKRQKSRHSMPPPHLCPPPPKPWVPWLMPIVFVVNVAMFVYTMYVNDCPTTGEKCLFPFLKRFSFQPFRENPLLGPAALTLKKLGALELQLVVEGGEGWRLLSCMWLHAGVVHLLFNMLSLLFIGIRLEQEFGFVRIGFLYLLAGIGGSLGSTLHRMRTASPTISVGASGALFGLLGAMLSELLINWTIYVNKCTALLILMVVIAVNMAVGFIPKVDSSAHIGGFLAGFFLGFVILVRPQYGYISSRHLPSTYEGRRKSRHKFYQYVLGITAFVFLVLGYTYGFGKLYGPPALKNLP
ncbi:hypothetical protein ACFX15_024582 [Malus domestica]